MINDSVLQVRIPKQDLYHLQSVTAENGTSISAFLRHILEPTIASSKIASLASRYPNISTIVMFGSMARGDHDADSDIDLAISLSKPSSWMDEGGIGEFLRKAEDATGRKIDYIPLGSCDAKIADDVIRDGRVVYAKQT